MGMKKIILVLFILLVACSKGTTINYTEITSNTVDMSTYQDMKSLDHQFREITTPELIKVFDEKGSGAFYLGSASCSFCQETVRYMNEAAKNLDIVVYYVDVYSETEPFMDYYDNIYQKLYPVLEERDGEKVILTPHYFTLINGEFASSCVGGLQDSPEETVIYFEELLKPLAE